ncbi:ABC transporter ATP-binding protein [Archangium lansingense]|uniref:ABC transporter ATP-binding protein n=1 Tax=Archangium lansingense TaxID=2995310 RepID=A0ABT4AD71_9BACT|nr:ABC transporter ATP-binding protein [Archangium lansinium]MCY1079618.1 ABC transporter ATP-binding protein [Archangium lansinium]
MATQETQDAIVIQDVVKSFKKRTIKGEYTTFKSELVSWLRGQRRARQAGLIESLRGITLNVPRGKTMAILGRNGSGKSTLLKLITGIYTPTSGNITVNGRISALLDLGAGFHPDFSGRENILINGIILGMSRAEVQAKMNDIIAFCELGDFIDEPVRTYSSGMYMRLAFSVATHVEPDILIVDEILAVGDEHFSKKSMAKMMEFKRQGKTIVLVTHDLETVKRWCDVAAWIDGGRIRRVGAPAEVAEEYRKAVAIAEAQSVVFTPPALSEGGLPQVPEEKAEVPQAESAPVGLSVSLRDPSGEELRTLSPEQPVEVQIDYTAREGVEGAEFEVALEKGDGTFLYRTSTRIDAVHLPKPLPSQGRLRLQSGRLGLLGGEYVLAVRVKVAGATSQAASAARCRFKVVSEREDAGLFRPPHQWVVEAVPAVRPEEQSLRLTAS